MASKKNSRNTAFRNSFVFGLLIVGSLFFFGGGAIYHILLRVNESVMLKKMDEEKNKDVPVPEKEEDFSSDEPQIRIDTVYETKYVTESCKKKHCEESPTAIEQPNDSTAK